MASSAEPRQAASQRSAGNGPRRDTPITRIGRGLAYLWHDPVLASGLALGALLVVVAALGPLVWTASPFAIDVGSSLQPPSLTHPMGTDSVGRDLLARFDQGARISLATGAIVVVVSALIGGAIGITAGYLGGWLDILLMRMIDAILAFPPLVLAMAVTVGLGVGVTTSAIGIILTAVPFYARLLRSDVIRLKALPLIEATAALGATRTRIMLRHILPHLVSTLLIQAASVFGYAILSLAALGFVGLGAQVPTPEWGTMITNGLQYALTGQWWIALFPGLGLLLAVTATSQIADRGRDIFDPRSR
ncbi:MAG: binding-protein-dependent transport system inner rane protein [Chloroflexi bacterium]|nr:binding-protein-dependent transport system inner rane protein [Chloroflexota bacterium]